MRLGDLSVSYIAQGKYVLSGGKYWMRVQGQNWNIRVQGFALLLASYIPKHITWLPVSVFLFIH